MNDRRRINGPPGGTRPPIFASTLPLSSNSKAREQIEKTRPVRTRRADEVRKIFLRPSITPSATGSAYYELSPPAPVSKSDNLFLPPSSSPKISVTVHGPHPLPRSSPYNSTLAVTCTVKFAPFATRERRGYIRDAAERDLAAHLETAIKGVIIGERWPKSGIDVVVTVLEGEEDRWWADEYSAAGAGSVGGWGLMSVLAGIITASGAAIVDAGIDCVDLISGGVAAVVEAEGKTQVMLDPSPAEHQDMRAACVVGLLGERDEITECWLKGDSGKSSEDLVEKAVEAATISRSVLSAVLLESANGRLSESKNNKSSAGGDVVMAG